MNVYYHYLATPMGTLLIACRSSGLLGVYYHDQSDCPEPSAHWQQEPEYPLLNLAVTQLEEYFHGKRRTFNLPLHWTGTLFQQQVWQAMLHIPFATTTPYAALAASIGRPRAARAVGAAAAANPWLLIVPCHRVIGSHGALVGFGAGIERKRALLDFEQYLFNQQTEIALAALASTHHCPSSQAAYGKQRALNSPQG